MFKRHTYTFGFRRFSVAEKRLIFDDAAPEKKKEKTPDALLGDGSSTPLHEVMRTNEQQRVHWENIESILDIAVRRSGNKQLHELWKSPEMRRWIIAQVRRNPRDGTLTWLGPTGQHFAERFEKLEENQASRLEWINSNVTVSVSSLVKTLTKAVQEITNQAAADGDKLPDGVDTDALRSILEKLTNEETLKNRQHGLVEIARVIIASEEGDLKAEIQGALDRNKALLGDDLHTKLQDELIKLAQEVARSDDKQKKLLDAIIKHAKIEFAEADRATIDNAIARLNEAIAELNGQRDTLLAREFTDQTQYLRMLAGDNRESVVRSGILENYKYNKDLFIASVKAAKQDLTPDQEANLKDLIDSSFTISDESAKELTDRFGVTLQDVTNLAKDLNINLPPNAPVEGALALVVNMRFGTNLDITKATLPEIQKGLAETALKELLTLGKDEFEKKYKDFLDAAEKHIPGFQREQVYRGLVAAWDIGEDSAINAYMRDELGLNETVGYNLRKMIYRARFPSEVAQFMIDGDIKLRIGDAITLSELETLTSGSAQFDVDKSPRIIVGILAKNSDEFEATEAQALRELGEKVSAYLAAKNNTTKASLETFVKNTLFDLPEAWKNDALSIVSGLEADMLSNLERLLKAELVTAQDLNALKTLSAELKAEQDPAEKQIKKDKLLEKLREAMKPFPELLAEAEALVTTPYTDVAEAKLLALVSGLPEDTSLLNANKIVQAFAEVRMYSNALGKPDEAVKRQNLREYFGRHLQGNDLNRVNAMLDTSDTMSDEAAKEIVDMVVDDDGEIEKAHFVDVIAFLQLQEASGSKTPADRYKEAVTAAETLWENLVQDNVIQDVGASTFSVPDKQELIKRVVMVRVGRKTKEMHQKLHEREIYKLNFGQATQQYIHQFFGDLWETSGSWVDYMKNLSSVVVPTTGPKMADMIKQRDRLIGIRSALKSAVDIVDGSDEMIRRAIEELKRSKKQKDDIVKPLKATAKIGDAMAQATYLMEANAYVITILRAEDNWDELPDPIRQTSLWIAMSQGESPEEGLVHAKEFIRQYMRAPNALHFYEEAYDAFTNAPTPENLAKLQEAILAYQQASGMEDATVKEYLNALTAYTEAIGMLNPVAVIGKEMTVYTEDGKKRKAEILSIDPTTKNTEGDTLIRATVAAKGKKKKGGNKEEEVWVRLGDAVQVSQNANASALAAATTAFVDAANALNARQLDERDPRSKAYEQFYQNYIAGLSAEDRTNLLEYRRKIETVREVHGANVLDSMFHRHGLFLKPAALYALSQAKTDVTHNGATLKDVGLNNGSFSMDRWLNEGHRAFADEPLRLILGGPPAAREALIRAYVNREDVEYDSTDAEGNPIKKTVTAGEAFADVALIKETLQMQSEQRQQSFELLEQDELFADPIQRTFRGVIESMRDLWSGDWIDKGQVILGIAAAVWLLREVWKKGSDPDSPGILKLAKYAVVGLPILMVANSAYKARTGRDILGEKMLFLSPQKRESLLEQWRRRSAEYGEARYAILGQPAGFAAMQELMRKEDPVSIKDLHDWRMNVKNGGFNDYLSGKPDNLDLFEIQSRLGINASEEKAAEVAFFCYEALCADVAALHSMDSGDVRSRANWGSDYLFQEYHQALSYKDVPADATGKTSLQQLLQRRGMGMMDVILMEAQLAARKNNVDKNLTVIERMGTFAGVSGERIQSLIGRAGVEFEYRTKQGKEMVDTALPEITNWLFNAKEDVVEWFRVRYPYAETVFVDNFVKSWEALKGVGITIVEVTPGVLEFVADGTIDITSSTIKKLKDTHDYLLLHEGILGELRLVKKFEEFVLSTVGIDFLKELSTEEAQVQIGTNISQKASFYDGGMYVPIDGKGKYTISKAYRGKRAHALQFGTTEGTDFVEMTFDEAKEELLKHMNSVSKEIFGKDKVEDLEPGQQRLVLEIVDTNIFRNIATHPNMQIAIEQYNRELNEKEAELDRAMERLSAVQPDIATKITQLSEMEETLGPLLLKSADEIKEKRDEEIKALERSINEESRLKIALADVVEELEEVEGTSWYLNGRKFTLERQIEWHEKKSKEHAENANKLHVYWKIAQNVPLADRRNFSVYDTATIPNLPNSGEELMGTITVNGQPRALIMHNDFVEDAIIEAMNDVDRYTQLEEAIEQGKDDQRELIELVRYLTIEVRKLKSQGVTGVQIEVSDLFRDADNAQILAGNRARLSTELLTAVFNEPGSLFGIPLVSLFGEAGDIAQKRIEAWVQRRVENDSLYRKHVEKGEDPAARIAYERYLASVGLNETFQRAMVKDGGYGEKESPLHLSYNEALKIDKYLEERERLVSFAVFIEQIWDVLPEDKRSEFLP